MQSMENDVDHLILTKYSAPQQAKLAGFGTIGSLDGKQRLVCQLQWLQDTRHYSLDKQRRLYTRVQRCCEVTDAVNELDSVSKVPQWAGRVRSIWKRAGSRFITFG